MAITSSGTASGGTITSSGGQYSILSGATLVVQDSPYVVSGAIVSGFGQGPDNSDALPGQSGGTNYPALLLASAGGVASDAQVGFGGVVMAANAGRVEGGYAVDSGSFVAVNGGTVNNVTIGSDGGVLASMLPSYGGAAGLVTNAHVQAGGYGLAGGGFTIKGQEFAGSGIISGGTFDVGSTEILVSAGTDIGSLIGGTQVISSAGYSLSSIFSAGTQLISAGGVASANTAYAGGSIHVLSGGVSYRTTVGSGGSVEVAAGGMVNGLTLQAAAAATARPAAVISNATVNGGGTLTIDSGATLAGGTIQGTTSDGGAAGLLIVQSGAVLNGLSIGWKGRIDVDTLSYTSRQSIRYANGQISIVDSQGNVLWSAGVTGSGSNTAADYHLEQDADGSTIIVYDKCFLKGTMIRTPGGERAVEDIKVGDHVSTLVDGEVVQREVIWVGRRSATVRDWMTDDEAGYPVRIRKGALGDNVPYKDLLVTPEHAIYLDGGFVPARMLVNGRSILYDHKQTHFDYFHIETDIHSILWSDGALSESYLDTGDRTAFSQDGQVVRLLNAKAQCWEQDAAAPLRIARDFVEPLFRKLEARADMLAYAAVEQDIEVTEDPDLHLLDERGRVIRQMRVVDRARVFMVPPGTREVRIMSRISRPVDVVGPFLDDRRHLGVLIAGIQIWEAEETHRLEAYLTDETLEGWAEPEGGRSRWTAGAACLPLDGGNAETVRLLSIEVIAGGPYRVERDSERAESALAS